MAKVNRRRILIGSFAGFAAWVAWGFVVHYFLLREKYQEAQSTGALLSDVDYPKFLGLWLLVLLGLSYVGARIYAGFRGTYGPGPHTALRAGVLLAFAAAVPVNIAASTWSPGHLIFGWGWILDLAVGSILATFIAAWLYKE
ncbi:MAG: hypothetical protein L0212_13045 [Acidobacteria bacterium]|nr:hypothetical protein [Acidobacteriota bacterium]